MTRGVDPRSWDLGPLNICRRGQSMFDPSSLKIHILSFKAVVG